jgi:hypothetical protein
MLFVLDSSIANLDLTCDKNGRALENLLGSFQHRDHLLFGKITDLALLLERAATIISNSSLSVLRTLYNRVIEYKTIVDLIEHKVVVYAENDDLKGIRREGSTWFAPIVLFSDAGLLQTAILCENEIDSQLYLLFAEMYCSRNKIRGFLPKGRERGGGGSVLPIALDRYLRSEISPCLCFTDSDKVAPHRPVSETSKRCEIAVVEARNRIAAHIALNEREAENILPLDLLRQVSDVETIKKHLAPLFIQDRECWSYLDLKEGITLDWILKQDGPTQLYWQPISAMLKKRRSVCKICKGGASVVGNGCGCTKVAGLGVKVLSKAVSYLTENPHRLTLRLLDNDLRWERIGKVVFDFTVAPAGMANVR